MQEIKEIDCKLVKQELDANQIYLIDVREPIEYQEENISGSVLMPLSSFDPAKVLAHKPSDKKLVIHCRSGKRAEKAIKQLSDNGCLEVFNMTGGMEAWKTAGLPINKPSNNPFTLIRQVHITIGIAVLAGVLLGHFVSPYWLILAGFFGAGLLFAGLTGFCGLAMLLARMPWNQISSPATNTCKTSCGCG